jgi:purine-binding chemotaxis protein CheW
MANDQLLNTAAFHRVVTFNLGTEECSFPIEEVHQILREAKVTKVPNVNRFVEGVFNLRGVVIPVLDLKFVLGLGMRKPSDSERLLILDVDGRLVGFSVDSVNGVFEFGAEQMQDAPDVVLSKMIDRFIRGVVRRGRSIVILLDTNEIVKVRRSERGSDVRSVAVNLQ